jgi:outer membrane receptor for ferrienterochelin and colicin
MTTKIFILIKGLFIIYALFELSVTSAQSKSYNINGIIKDSISGEALVYANVLIEGTETGSVSNEGGYFVIVGAPRDTLTLIISYIGYTTKRIHVNNSNGSSDQLIVMLKPKPVESGEVVIKGENYKMWKSDDEAARLTISPREISNLPRVGDADIFRALQLLPGIHGINDGAELSVLGGTPDQNLVLLDGMTVYHVNHLFGFFSAFNSDAIKEVSIYKGGYPAKFGGRLSSVIDLNGKTGNVNEFNLDVGLSLLSINGMTQIPFFNKGSILISARRSFSGLLYDDIFNFLSGNDEEPSVQAGRLQGARRETELPVSYFYDLNAKISYQISPKDFASISFYSGDDFLDQTQEGGGPASASGAGNSGGVTEWGNIGTSFKWLRQWDDVFFSSIIFSYSKYKSDNKYESNVPKLNAGDSDNSSIQRTENNQINDFTISLDNEWAIAGFNKLGIGGTISSIKTDYSFVVGDSSIVGLNNNGLSSAFYIQDKLEVLNSLDFTLGMRITYYDLTKKTYWEPRASFNFSFLGNLKLKGAWGKYHQFINQITHEDILQGNRDFWIISDENMKPAFSEHYILGLEYEISDYFFSTEGFYKKFNNLVEFSQRIPLNANNIDYYLANFYTGNGYSKGLEFFVQKRFGALNWWASYTLSKVEYTFPDFDNGNPFPADQDRTHEIKIAGDFTLGNWVFSGSWVFATGKPYTSPISKYYVTLLNGEREAYIHVSDKNEYRLPDYQRLDISAIYNFEFESHKGQVGASIYNLYNYKNVWYRKFDLSSDPIKVIDVSMLGLTPTLFIKMNF